MSKLLIKDQKFALVSARLEPFLSDDDRAPAKDHRFVWGVVVEAEEKDVAEGSWEPSLTIERLLETKPNEVESWQDLVGRHGKWKADDEMALLYTFSHEAVLNVSWRFERAKSGRLVFILDGKSRFNHGKAYVGMLPIHLEAELDYANIPMGKRKEAACRKRITRFGIQDPFDFQVENGVSYLIPKNYPKRRA